MVPGNTLTLIIPAYNEADHLPDFLVELEKQCQTHNWQAIIVNDGSSDDTMTILAKQAGSGWLRILHHKRNRGYGAAIKSGIRACATPVAITLDADGQHQFTDVLNLYQLFLTKNADMVVGSRKGTRSASLSRGLGKRIIRSLAKILMYVPIHDLNSGMKVFRTDLAYHYLNLTPDTMAYSDIITLIFLNNRHLVLEHPISVIPRQKGTSSINLQTAFQTVMEIINIVMLFNPAKIFLPLAGVFFLAGLGIGVPLILNGNGVSTGSLLGIFGGIIFFLLSLIAEQLSNIRKNTNGSAPE